ncbi:unnamed protein product [Staurois parvus]|uniref:Uncharacterized protein n=1 Tax=Staurois parvus TaxID=386267 RepID=A0ABN9AEK3_9NEOB|nr:unnamed protein product [Staurois parvus]
MGPLGNRGSWGPCVLAHTQTTPKKAYERYQGHLMGPPTDPGPSGSARVSKWSVRPCYQQLNEAVDKYMCWSSWFALDFINKA